jgi:hypothetical protein
MHDTIPTPRVGEDGTLRELVSNRLKSPRLDGFPNPPKKIKKVLDKSIKMCYNMNVKRNTSYRY